MPSAYRHLSGFGGAGRGGRAPSASSPGSSPYQLRICPERPPASPPLCPLHPPSLPRPLPRRSMGCLGEVQHESALDLCKVRPADSQGSALHDSNRPGAAAQPRRRLRKGPGSQERRGLQKALDGAVWGMRWVELDGDHAFGDCGSRRPMKAASKNPCHMRGNPSTEAGRGTAGCYVERPAREDSTSLAEAPASRLAELLCPSPSRAARLPSSTSSSAATKGFSPSAQTRDRPG